jgi:hypothetical protein
MSKPYDDLVLEVATELEATVRKGDFLANLERRTIRLRQSNKPKSVRSELRVADAPAGEPERIDWSIILPVTTVLAGRQVDPKDVVAVFGDNRFIDLRQVEPEGQCFILTQRHIGDEDYLQRVATVDNLLDGHQKAIDEIKRKLAECATLRSQLDAQTRLYHETVAAVKSAMTALETYGQSEEGQRLRAEKEKELYALAELAQRQLDERMVVLETYNSIQKSINELLEE